MAVQSADARAGGENYQWLKAYPKDVNWHQTFVPSPLYELLDTLGTVLHAYEEKHHVLPESSGADMLRFFMDEHGLAQSEVPEVGSQGVVSEILSGKRELNVRQIRALAERFHVSPAVFI